MSFNCYDVLVCTYVLNDFTTYLVQLTSICRRLMPRLARRHSAREGQRRPPDRAPVRRMTLPVCRRTMSGPNARRSDRAALTERQILTEFLKLYKTFPCLWDQKHMQYGNREARDEAYEQLLEKYKEYHEGGTTVDVKKKIEYMRCAYRREHKKVLMGRFHGSHYKPQLWYYNLLKFLNENNDGYNDQTEIKNESNISMYDDGYQQTQEIIDSDEEETKPKRRKKSNNCSTVYIEENALNIEEYLDQDVLDQDQNQIEVELPQSYIISNEAEAFGRTVGFQLKELSHIQRVLAEKLISDVIFQARLGKLSVDTALNSD